MIVDKVLVFFVGMNVVVIFSKCFICVWGEVMGEEFCGKGVDV